MRSKGLEGGAARGSVSAEGSPERQVRMHSGGSSTGYGAAHIVMSRSGS
jgi:hypothetical protein